MKFQLTTVLPLLGALSTITLVRADCVHNNDAGRWRDSDSPAGRVAALCGSGGGCFTAEVGRMCVTGDLSHCSEAIEFAANQQSFHSDWFLWSAIQCDGLDITITATD